MLDVKIPNSEGEADTFECRRWNDHLMLKGSSPSLTTQVSWANAPSFITSFPKLKGTIFGGSVNEKACEVDRRYDQLFQSSL